MDKPKIILGIETSCDETAAAVARKDNDGVIILSNIVASSALLQAKYGGVVPEQAAREQLSNIIPVIQEALSQAFPDYQPTATNPPPIDAIAVTQGPGLIGSLLVGVETAKILSLVWEKPLVPVNHLVGHFYANWIKEPSASPSFPAIGLLVSGGHTDLVLMKGHGKFEYLGGTRDDAAGEAFDKTARLLGLPYPGGPVISKLAEKGDPGAFKLPRPMIDSKDSDFSFSGLKTAVSNIVHSSQFPPKARLAVGSTVHGKNRKPTNDLCASVEEAIVDVLATKTLRAARIHNVGQIVVAGGVAANKKLAEIFLNRAGKEISRAKISIPPPKLCTDNAAYIAAAAFFNYHPINPLELQADPSLSLSHSA